jgi:hypothetical protein
MKCKHTKRLLTAVRLHLSKLRSPSEEMRNDCTPHIKENFENSLIHRCNYSCLNCIVYDKLLKPRQSFWITLYSNVDFCLLLYIRELKILLNTELHNSCYQFSAGSIGLRELIYQFMNWWQAILKSLMGHISPLRIVMKADDQLLIMFRLRTNFNERFALTRSLGKRSGFPNRYICPPPT